MKTILLGLIFQFSTFVFLWKDIIQENRKPLTRTEMNFILSTNNT